MAISFNGNTLTGVVIGDTPVNAVYCNGNLVFDSWIPLSFPNGNDKMPNNDNKYRGFNATGSTRFTSSYTHNKSFNGSDNDCYATSDISGTPYLFLKFPFEFGDSAIITSIKVTYGDPDTAIPYASEGKIYLITSGTDPNQNREKYSDDFTIGSPPKTFNPISTAVNIRCGGVVFTSKKNTVAKYGNITVNFKLPWSKWNAWRQQYDIS